MTRILLIIYKNLPNICDVNTYTHTPFYVLLVSCRGGTAFKNVSWTNWTHNFFKVSILSFTFAELLIYGDINTPTPVGRQQTQTHY